MDTQILYQQCLQTLLLQILFPNCLQEIPARNPFSHSPNKSNFTNSFLSETQFLCFPLKSTKHKNQDQILGPLPLSNSAGKKQFQLLNLDISFLSSIQVFGKPYSNNNNNKKRKSRAFFLLQSFSHFLQKNIQKNVLSLYIPSHT